MANNDDEITRLLAEMSQKLGNMGRDLKANRLDGEGIRDDIRQMRGDLAVVISWADDNKKKSNAYPPLFAG